MFAFLWAATTLTAAGQLPCFLFMCPEGMIPGVRTARDDQSRHDLSLADAVIRQGGVDETEVEEAATVARSLTIGDTRIAAIAMSTDPPKTPAFLQQPELRKATLPEHELLKLFTSSLQFWAGSFGIHGHLSTYPGKNVVTKSVA